MNENPIGDCTRTPARGLLAFGLLLAMSLVSGMADAAAGPRQDLQVLADLAHEFALDQAEEFDADRVEVRVSRLDRRLKLALCTGGMEAFQPPGSQFPGRGTVGVRCEGPSHWTVYASVEVKIYEPVVAAKTFLRKGMQISENDVELRSVNIASLASGYFMNVEEVLGMEVKRNLKPGRALTPAQLRKQKLVRRGEQVSLVVRAGGLRVTSRGKSLGDGAKGDRVMVKNLRSDKKVEGVVSAAGVVTVGI